MGIKIQTEKDRYTMGEPIRCRVLVDSDFKKPGHLRVGLVCVENATVTVKGKKETHQHIIYDWGITLVENKPVAKNSIYDVVFETPKEWESQLAYPPSYVSKGKQGKVDVVWGWNIFAVFAKPVRESGEMAWLMENLPERIRDDMDVTEEEKTRLAEDSRSGSGFVYSLSLFKDSSFERAVKPITMNYPITDTSTGEAVVAKFTEVGELRAPSRYVKQGEGLNLELKVWNPTPKPGKVNGFRGIVECWNANTMTGDRIGASAFVLKENGKVEPGDSIELPLKTPAFNGPPTILGKEIALIWTCRMESELSWFGKQYAALSFHLLPIGFSNGVKKLKLFKFQPIFTDSGASEVPFSETLVRSRVEHAIPALKARILEIIPRLWISR